MKKTLPALGLAISTLLLPVIVSAQTLTTSVNSMGEKMKDRLEHRVEMKKEHKEIKKLERIVMGKVTAISGTNITLVAKKGTYTVDASSAKLVRRFGATMTIGEIIVNDELMVNGTVSSSTGTTIVAKMIRNISLQAKNGTFEGTISNLSATGFTVATKNRKDQTITVNASTTFSKEGKTAAMTDLTTGSRVVVKGVWDRANSIVTAKSVRIVIPTKYVMGTVSSLVGNSLVITSSASSTFTVDVTGAKLVRRHGSTATLAEIKVGDKVEVRGKQPTAASVISALWVKDLSITASSTK